MVAFEVIENRGSAAAIFNVVIAAAVVVALNDVVVAAVIAVTIDAVVVIVRSMELVDEVDHAWVGALLQSPLLPSLKRRKEEMQIGGFNFLLEFLSGKFLITTIQCVPSITY